jgi:hypothetical protein
MVSSHRNAYDAACSLYNHFEISGDVDVDVLTAFHERTQRVITNHDTAELPWKNAGVLALGTDLYQCCWELARLSQNTTNKSMREMPQRLKDFVKGDITL